MVRQDNEYWQRLRKDKRTAFAVGLAILGMLAAVLGLIGLMMPDSTHYESRQNPLYWALLIPFGLWGASLTRYEPIPVATLRPAYALAPLASGILALWAHSLEMDVTPFLITLVVSLSCGVLGELLYRGSMLKLEGPAR